MNKYSHLLFVMAFSFLFADANVQIRLQNGQKAQGEFLGTYMNHVHILVGEKIIYYACDDIISITYADGGFSYGKGYDYDCSKNTVTADILFPPELDPMTGEMTQMLPDVFNPDIPKPAAKVEDGLKLINKTPKEMKEEMGIKVEAGTKVEPVTTDFDKLVLKNGTTYFGEYIKIEREKVFFKTKDAFALQPVSLKQIESLELKDIELYKIISASYTGIVWAQTDFDKLVLKDGTTYLGEYSKTEEEIVYFKPQNAFSFQLISIKRIQTLVLKDGQILYDVSKVKYSLAFEDYQTLSTEAKLSLFGCTVGMILLNSSMGLGW